MNATTHQQGHDGALTGRLAEVVSRLRARPYGSVIDRLDGGLHDSADRFVAELAEHLDYEERALFPAVREARPDLAAGLDRLQEEHRLLRIYAQDLAGRIDVLDREGAFEVSRAFLAALMDHIDRERALTEALEVKP
jgi:hemerythrin-like domain-containing protein